jgi:hypothetical protein
MLHEKPSIPNHLLHPEITHDIPPYNVINAFFMGNFPSHVLAHVLNNPIIDVLLEDVGAFTSQCVIAVNKVIDLD